MIHLICSKGTLALGPEINLHRSVSMYSNTRTSCPSNNHHKIQFHLQLQEYILAWPSNSIRSWRIDNNKVVQATYRYVWITRMIFTLGIEIFQHIDDVLGWTQLLEVLTFHRELTEMLIWILKVQYSVNTIIIPRLPLGTWWPSSQLLPDGYSCVLP